MSQKLNTAIFAADPGQLTAANETVAKFDRVAIAWTAGRSPELWDRLTNSPPDAMVFGLDPSPAESASLLGQVSARFPNVRIIAFSAEHAPEIIITAMRNGCSQFVFFPLDADDLWQALQRLMLDRSAASRASGRRIAVIGAAGGTGATAIASNLATEVAALAGRDVALLDFNLEFGDAASNFDVTPKHTIADLIGHADVDANLLRHAMENLDNGVWLLARPERIDDAFAITPELAAHILHLLPTVYDASVIDLPRRFDGVGMTVLENSEIILIVMQMIVPHIHNGRRLYEAMRQWGVNMDRVHLIINRYQKNRGRIDIGHVEKLFNRRVITSIPNDYRAVTAALEYGRPIMADSANSDVRIAIRDLAAKLMQPDVSEVMASPDGASGRKLMKKIFG